MPARIDESLIPISPDLSFESALWFNSITNIAGLDEAGRGAWAGPVAAAAVILPNNPSICDSLSGVQDSKQISPSQRCRLAPKIKEYALSWAIGFSDNNEIDNLGILFATRLAMQRAILMLSTPPEYLLLDALFLPEIPLPQTALIKGDRRCLSIAAASILAKTTRDEWMVKAHQDFPDYGFDHHKGYGTKIHQNALAAIGKCNLHRSSFRPLKELDRKQ